MARDKLSIKLTNESKITIKRLARAGKFDLRPSFKVIGIGYRKEVKAIFERQQPRLRSLKWPSLSEAYARQKEREFPGRPILVKTGDLKNSMTKQGAKGNITIIGKTEAIFGTTIPYGIYHDSNRARFGKLPRRNFSEPSERREAIWVRQISHDISNNFRRASIQVEEGL